MCTITPASPFLPTFARALLAGEVVSGLGAPDDPLRLADLRIYVPTRRAARALGDALRLAAGTTSLVLPRCLPLGALDESEPELIFANTAAAEEGEADWLASGERDAFVRGAALPPQPAAGAIWRRLELAKLIHAWSSRIGGALRTINANGDAVVDPSERFRVATTSADAFALAGELARVIDEMIIEDVDWRAIETVDVAAMDEYWRVTTTFLAIAAQHWPQVLAQHGLVDPARRQTQLLAAQEHLLAHGSLRGPVIAIGSTGSNRATARLLAAIARLEHGAVVLPGLDKELGDPDWKVLSNGIGSGGDHGSSHPQSALARLLPTLGIARADVRELGAADPDRALRIQFVNQALKPAETTDTWPAWRRRTKSAALAGAFAEMCLVEAANEREEALVLAIAMREVLEHPERRAILVTADRELARRVRGELLRWDIEVLDSAGEPLAKRPLGVFARLTLAAGQNVRGAGCLAHLLAHPLAGFGRPRRDVARLASKLDIGVLRAVPLTHASTELLFRQAEAAAADTHAHPSQKAISDADWSAMARLWDDIIAALAPLSALEAAQPLDAWVAAHRAAVAAALLSAAPFDEQEARALERVWDELGSEGGLRFDAEGYAILFARVAHEVALRNTERPHPQLEILGLLEARLIHADVVLVGGLDEGVWPPQAVTDPFFNRPIRQQLGLSSPERRLGQTAHDFIAALGNRRVILTRCGKRAGTPCVPSRFLLRMEALGGAEMAQCRARGQEWLRLARLIDRPASLASPGKRPAPKPPLALRPARLSVTQIETLRRDPYSIFASHVLRLQPLPEMSEDFDVAAFGNQVHDVLHQFSSDARANQGEDLRRAALSEIAQRVFADLLLDPLFKALRWPPVERLLKRFLDFDAGQRETAQTIATEISGKLEVRLADDSPFQLTARADRLELHRNAKATLVDFKTGRVPSNTEVAAGFAPQLTLEGAMLSRGAFPVSAVEISAMYLKLGGKKGLKLQALDFKDGDFETVAEQHYTGMVQLLSSYRDVETAYPSYPFPKWAKRFGTYDHLARRREWSLIDDSDPSP